jgi:hypothetical protein
MALLNYVGQGTYSIADNIIYMKSTLTLRWQLDIYSDQTKQNLLCSKMFDVNGLQLIPGVLKLNQSIIPINPQLEDSYVISEDAEGEWKNYPGQIAKWNGERWEYWYFVSGQVIYDEETDRYYRFVDEKLVSTMFSHDIRLWNKYFTSTLIQEHGLQAQIYKYMKTLSGFDNVVDA